MTKQTRVKAARRPGHIGVMLPDGRILLTGETALIDPAIRVTGSIYERYLIPVTDDEPQKAAVRRRRKKVDG